LGAYPLSGVLSPPPGVLESSMGPLSSVLSSPGLDPVSSPGLDPVSSPVSGVASAPSQS
jgi:hypothetical protein